MESTQWPLEIEIDVNHNETNPLPWTGTYFEGFNNKITMHAYANPDTESNGCGYGQSNLKRNLMKWFLNAGQEVWTSLNPMPNNLQAGQ